MIVDLSEETQNLLEKVKKELGKACEGECRPLPDDEVIKDALMCYYVDAAQINRQKNKFKKMK